MDLASRVQGQDVELSLALIDQAHVALEFGDQRARRAISAAKPLISMP